MAVVRRGLGREGALDGGVEHVGAAGLLQLGDEAAGFGFVEDLEYHPAEDGAALEAEVGVEVLSDAGDGGVHVSVRVGQLDQQGVGRLRGGRAGQEGEEKGGGGGEAVHGTSVKSGPV